MQKRKAPLQPILNEDCPDTYQFKHREKKTKLAIKEPKYPLINDDDNELTNSIPTKNIKNPFNDGPDENTFSFATDDSTASVRETLSLKKANSQISCFSTQSSDQTIVKHLESTFSTMDVSSNTSPDQDLTAEQIFDCTYKPLVIKFREQEQAQIKQFITKCQHGQLDFRCLLITGMPGSGKTLTVSRVLEDMLKENRINQSKPKKCEQPEEKAQQSQQKELKVLQFNAMNFKTSMDFIISLYGCLLSKKDYHKKSMKDLLIQIQQYQSDNADQDLIIMVDEFDSLFTKSTQEIFEIFSLVKHSNTCLIGISNSMEMVYDLFKKFKITLPQIKNIVFQPYSQQEMSEIIQQRVKEMQEIVSNLQSNNENYNFDLKALKLCSGKLHNLKGGDIRCLFDVCKKALQSKKQQKLEKIISLLGSQTTQSPPSSQSDINKKNFCQINDDKSDNLSQKSNETEEQKQCLKTPPKNIICDKTSTETIEIKDLIQIIENLYSKSQSVKIMQDLPTQQQLIVIAIYKILEKQEGLIEVQSKQILEYYNKVCMQLCLMKSDLYQINENLKILEAYSILQIRNNEKNIGNVGNRKSIGLVQIGNQNVKIFLKVTADEISAGLGSISSMQQFFQQN